VETTLPRKFINGVSFAIVPLGHCRMKFTVVVGGGGDGDLLE
jgi:hypothetical protein